jgi:hypothetical protein
MSARSFRSVFMVASCAGAALGCYLVSLRVASERASLEDVETRIVLAQRDIRLLQTEVGTRGRLAQLERWNAKVLALSAPSADQFLEGGFQLARLTRPEPKIDVQAPVVLASAPAPRPQSAPLDESEQATDDGAGANVPAARLMHQASLRIPVRSPAPPAQMKAAPAPNVAVKAAAPQKAPAKLAETRAPAASKKDGDNKAQPLARPVTKPVRTARVDPLAPLAATGKSRTKTARDSGTAR